MRVAGPYKRASRSRSSRGPGHRPLTAVTGVRIPYGTPFADRLGGGVRGTSRPLTVRSGGCQATRRSSTTIVSAIEESSYRIRHNTPATIAPAIGAIQNSQSCPI